MLLQVGSPHLLLLPVLGAEGDVVRLSRAGTGPVVGPGPAEKSHGRVGPQLGAVVTGPEPVLRLPVVLVERLLHHRQPQDPGVEVVGLLQVVGDARDVVDPKECHVRRDVRDRLRVGFRRHGPLVPVAGQALVRGRDEPLAQGVRRFVDGVARTLGGDLQDLPVGVGEVDAPEVASIDRTRDPHTRVFQTALPLELGLGGGHPQGQVVDATDAPLAATGLGPLEKVRIVPGAPVSSPK